MITQEVTGLMSVVIGGQPHTNVILINTKY
jgi:hypothetical protein